MRPQSIKTWYKDRLYDSKLEADYAEKLDRDKAFGLIQEWEPQVTYPLFLNGQKDCEHRVDFRVTRSNGIKEIHETKGREEALWLRKLSLFVDNYPHLRYVTVKRSWGRWQYLSSDEVLDRAGIRPIKSVLPPSKQYSHLEYALSWAVHTIAGFFFH